MAIDLNFSECTPTFTSEKHCEYPDRMQYLNGTLTHPAFGELATMRCLQIHGRLWFKNAGDFLEIMDEDSQELHEFSVQLFDKHSNVRPWLVDGGPRSGSGCWGMELSVGDMLYIEDLKVKEQFKRHGVGSWLLQKVLASPHMGFRGHAFCWPTPTSSTTDNRAEWNQERDAIISFYRQNGFRRIGLTQFFAYSPDPAHPSRRLAASADPERPSRDFDSPELTEGELIAQYPVHFEIATNKTPSVAEVIRAAYQTDEGSIRKRDPNGFMLIHVAAASENVHAARALLNLCSSAAMAEDLKDRVNKDAMTPLEVLQSSMRSTREFMETLLGAWNGYSDEGLSLEYLLTRAMGLPLLAGEETEAEYIKKRKLGCTCGKCTDGWLSPRMRFRLGAQAAIQNDMLQMDVSVFKSYHPLSASELPLSTFDYIPVTVRREIYKTFYIGFYTIFRAIYDVLKSPGRDRIPTPQAVLAAALELNPGAVQFYMSKGGKVEYVLDATVEIAKEQSSLGDGSFEETFDVDEAEEGGGGEENVRYAALGKCANDLEFGLVRRNVGLGLGVGVVWGPYRDWDEEDGMEVDYDDDEDEDEY